jgi:hypothetical protein
MEFTYKIDGFNKADNALLVLYTPLDSDKLPIYQTVYVTENMTQEEIIQLIINRAPIQKWNRQSPENIDQLIGQTGTASTSDIQAPIAVPGVFNYPDGYTGPTFNQQPVV